MEKTHEVVTTVIEQIPVWFHDAERTSIVSVLIIGVATFLLIKAAVGRFDRRDKGN